jgi:integrase/recombinase XerD
MNLSDYKSLFEERSTGLIAPSTLRSYKLSATTIQKCIGDKALEEYSVADFDSFKAEYLKTARPSSVNVVLRSMKAMFTRAVDWGIIEKNPMSRVKMVRVPQQSPQYLNREEQLQMLANVDDEGFRRLFEFLFNTGLRIGEALALTWDDVDLTRKQIRVVNGANHLTKTRKNRVVPLNDLALGALPEGPKTGIVYQREGQAYTVSHVSHRFKDYVRKAGLSESIHLHSTRHSFASNLAEKNVDLYNIAKLLGHSSPSTTTTLYAHVSTSHLHDVVDLLT